MDDRLGDFFYFLPMSLFKRDAWSEVSLYLSVVLSGNLAVWTYKYMVWYCRYSLGKYDLFVCLRICAEYTAVSWEYHKKGLFYSVDVWGSGNSRRYIFPAVYGGGKLKWEGGLF